MKTTIVNVTPAMAREWIKYNTDNRPLRSGHVEALRGAFVRGEYKPTHQGIAFDNNGTLLDGQHRLHAIALIDDPDAAFPMLVSRGMSRETFEVIDTGSSMRSVSDVLRINPQAGIVANFFAQLMLTRQKSRPTPAQVKPFADLIATNMDRLTGFCGANSRTWSCAAAKAAVILSMQRGYGDYALMVYRSMVMAKFDEMPTVAQALYRAHLSGSVRAGGGRDIFVRLLKAFNPANAKLSKVQIRDGNADLEDARKEVAAWMNVSPKKKAAPVTRAAKSVQADYRIAA